MRPVLIALSAVLTLVAAVPYLIEILQGKAKPRLASWFTWGAITGIGAAAAFAQHQVPAGVFALFCSLECFAVVVLGYQHGDRHLDKLDIVCLAGASVGLVALVLLKSPAIATVVVILTDFIAALPTIKHAWAKPHEETLSTYALSGVGSGITLLIANHHVFTAVGYPLYLFIVDFGVAGIIFYSPHRQQSTGAPAEPAGVTPPGAPPLPVPVVFQPAPAAAAPTAAALAPAAPAVPTAAAAPAPTVVAAVAPPPAPLAAPQLTAGSPTQVPTLSWPLVAGAAGYNIYRDRARVATSQLPNFVDTTAAENTYTYCVTAVNAAGESGPSNSVAVVVDHTPPNLTYQFSSQPNAKGWHNQPVTITFSAHDDKVGIASCSPPVTLDKDGGSQAVTGHAMNYAGESSTINAVVNIDQTPPIFGPPTWSANPAPAQSDVTLTVPVADHTSGVEQGEYAGDPDPGPGRGTVMSLNNGQLEYTFKNLPAGHYLIKLRAKDAAGNWSALVSLPLEVN